MKHLLYFLLIIGCTQAKQDVGNSTSGSTTEPKTVESLRNDFPFRHTKAFSLDELRLTHSHELALISDAKEHYTYYLESDWARKAKPFEDNLTFMELNGDGQPDVLFQGWSGGEPECVNIHLSTHEGLDTALSFYQYLKDLHVKDGHVQSMIILDPGCCAEYVLQELTYTFDAQFKPTLALQRAWVYPLPDSIPVFGEPISFRVENEWYKLRVTPMINDTGTYIYEHQEVGNTAAIFKKGATGKAWAKDTTDPEREWWFVEMDPISDTLEFDAFWYYDSTGQLRRMGWMSSRYLTRTD